VKPVLPALGLGLSSNAQRADVPRPYELKRRHPESFDYLEYSAPLDVEAAAREASLFDTMLAHRAEVPLVYHPVHLNLFGPALETRARLGQLNRHCARVGSPWVSNDVAWWHHAGELLPGALYLSPPMTAEALAVAVTHARAVQAAVEVPLLLENPTVTCARGPMHVLDFMARLSDESGCWVLLDVGHLVSHQLTRGRGLLDGLDDFDFGRVAQLHVAGGVITSRGGRAHYVDDHPQPVRDEVWHLLEHVAPRCTALKALTFEADGHPEGQALRGLERLRALAPSPSLREALSPRGEKAASELDARSPCRPAGRVASAQGSAGGDAREALHGASATFSEADGSTAAGPEVKRKRGALPARTDERRVEHGALRATSREVDVDRRPPSATQHEINVEKGAPTATTQEVDVEGGALPSTTQAVDVAHAAARATTQEGNTAHRAPPATWLEVNVEHGPPGDTTAEVNGVLGASPAPLAISEAQAAACWTLFDDVHAGRGGDAEGARAEQDFRLAVLAQVLDAEVPWARLAVAPGRDALATFMASPAFREGFTRGEPTCATFLRWAHHHAGASTPGVQQLLAFEAWLAHERHQPADARPSGIAPGVRLSTFELELSEVLFAAKALGRHLRDRAPWSAVGFEVTGFEGLLQAAARAPRRAWTVALRPAGRRLEVVDLDDEELAVMRTLSTGASLDVPIDVARRLLQRGLVTRSGR
jgi:uncharacterized protein (UPF0276 family)